MARTARAALVALLTAALAACGGSGDDDASAADPTTSSTAPPTTGAPTTTTTLHRDPVPVACATLTAFARHEGEQHLQATLDEWSIVFSNSTPDPGIVKINVRNVGSEPHALSVIKGPAASLPLTADGAVDEDALPEGANLGGVAVPAGAECELPVTLEAGTYTLVCNLVEGMGASPHVHYAKGMYKEITVS